VQKLEALDAITPPKLRSGRFRASDKLIASLTTRSLNAERKALKIAKTWVNRDDSPDNNTHCIIPTRIAVRKGCKVVKW
jgi:hypothetical protein